jgi:uncharacterized protein YrrD
MDFRFGAEIAQRDGGKFGNLRALVYDTGTKETVSLVIRRHPADDDSVLLPIGAVQSTDLDMIYVELSQQQFDGLPGFEAERNIAPPPDLDNIARDQVTDPIDVPDVPPVGAATGIESIAFTPLVEEEINVPEGDQVIDDGTAVWATDGELGLLRAVRVSDQTRRIDGVTVQEGGFFTTDTDIPANSIASVQSDAIILSIDKASVAPADE